VSVISLSSKVLAVIVVSEKDRWIKSAKKYVGWTLDGNANHFRLLGAMSHWKMSSGAGDPVMLDNVCQASSGAPKPEQSVAMRMARRHGVRRATRAARAAQAMKATSPADDDAIGAAQDPADPADPRTNLAQKAETQTKQRRRRGPWVSTMTVLCSCLAHHDVTIPRPVRHDLTAERSKLNHVKLNMAS
jgi:hypothetical protein